jgi:hypothetical protein
MSCSGALQAAITVIAELFKERRPFKLKKEHPSEKWQIISFRLIPLKTPVSFRWTVPLKLRISVSLRFKKTSGRVFRTYILLPSGNIVTSNACKGQECCYSTSKIRRGVPEVESTPLSWPPLKSASRRPCPDLDPVTNSEQKKIWQLHNLSVLTKNKQTKES